MMSYGPGALSNVAAYDEQNVQRLKKLGSSFNNLGYQGQLGTKQLQRLASTMSSLPTPPAPTISASSGASPWKPPPVQPVSTRAGFVSQGAGLTMNLNATPTWKADPVLFAPPKGGGAPMLPPPSVGRGKSLGRGKKSGSAGQGTPSSLSQTPYQSTLGKDTGGAATGGPVGGLSGLPNGGNRMASYQPTQVAGQSSMAEGVAGSSPITGSPSNLTSHARLGATGPSLTQRSVAQNAALPSKASYGNTNVQQSLSTLGDPKAQTGITARNNAAMSVPKKPFCCITWRYIWLLKNSRKTNWKTCSKTFVGRGNGGLRRTELVRTTMASNLRRKSFGKCASAISRRSFVTSPAPRLT